MTMEDKALKEIAELKFKIAEQEDKIEYLKKTNLCLAKSSTNGNVDLKQHNIALLNDIQQQYANGADIDFCDFFACYKINLELDDGT